VAKHSYIAHLERDGQVAEAMHPTAIQILDEIGQAETDGWAVMGVIRDDVPIEAETLRKDAEEEIRLLDQP